ncbi:MAG: sodium:solute symporter, partial [Bacteroidota bacterium]
RVNEAGKEYLDFEEVLPFAVNEYVTVGFKGLLLAGLLAAFMSTFAAFINAGSAYVVNDIYKRYVNDQAPAKSYVRLGYVVSFSLVIVGLVFGFFGGNIQSRTDWIVGLLYGSYVASNVLKWIWWRFNGYGFFWGMASGMIGVAILPSLMDALQWDLLAIEQFPLLMLMSGLGAILGTLLTQPEDDETLKAFYRKTRPWGFWEPIKQKVLAEDPSFQPNRSFGRDSINVLVGIVWQMALVVAPIAIMIRNWPTVWGSLVIIAITSYVLWTNWWKKLED